MKISLDFSYIEFVELLEFVYLCLSSNLENYYFSHYFTISLSLSFWEPHNALYWSVAMYHRLSFSLCSLFFIFPPLCSSDLFSGVLILSYTYSSLMSPVSDFFFFSIQLYFSGPEFLFSLHFLPLFYIPILFIYCFPDFFYFVV